MSRKAPKARPNSAAAIRKVCETCATYTLQHNGDNVKIHISTGNAKLGGIYNVSLPPVTTCQNCGSCSKYCYAVKDYNQYPNTRTAWNENYMLFLTDPERYFDDIERAARLQRFFRWHVSGDIVNAEYFAGMIHVARENPKCEFLAFTKAYEIVNNAINNGAVIPSNLHLLFSAAPGNDMPNPHRLPECHINFADPTLNTYFGGAEYEHHCNGNCEECIGTGCGCFFLKTGDAAIINQH